LVSLQLRLSIWLWLEAAEAEAVLAVAAEQAEFLLEKITLLSLEQQSPSPLAVEALVAAQAQVEPWESIQHLEH
jgi:hypothetical protein